MNLFGNRSIALFFLSLSLCSIPVNANSLIDVAQDQINKISPNSKPVAHKMPLEFKQAVARYIKHTDSHCLSNSQRHTDDNVSYKKELRYLFKNYGDFSTAALLLRLRSAHQAMVKHESDSGSDVYKRYEQISSALLLVCAQVFFNDVRNQILGALQEVDGLIAYWRYQHGHQLSYFFSKSPIKWIAGRSQDKEITQNLSRLERKQRELYTLLGSLTGHVHAFTESGTTYNDCYAWIEQLFVVLSSVKGLTHYNVDGTQFDMIAAELEAKIKRVDGLKDSYLTSIASTKKSNHFVRNWVPYTALAAGAAYAVHHHAHNPETFPAVIAGAQDSAKYLFLVLVDPLNKIYKRVQLAFSPKAESDVKDLVIEKSDPEAMNSILLDSSIMEEDLDPLFDEITQTAEEIVSDISNELNISKETARDRLFDNLKKATEAVKNPNDGNLWNSKYDFSEDKQKAFYALVEKLEEKRVQPVFGVDGSIINKEEWEGYLNAKKDLQLIIADLSKQTSVISSEGWSVCTKLNIFDILFDILDDFGEPLKKYTDIIDQKVLKLVRLIGGMAVNLGRRGDVLVKEANILKKEAVILIREANLKLEEADATLQDNQLTFMFTSLIPLMLTCAGVTKTYQWATKKNYSPIRIALSDINSLLIESAMQLDDHDYGKLVYLICKLRTKSKILKSPLSTDFLADIAKLESKRYTAQTKRDIVENMFNKYAFLGRIAV